MAARAGLFLFLILLAKSTAPEDARHVVVWNVGQGLWTTMVDGGCWHFDMGGEFAPWAQIMALCRPRKNYVHLSHWDSDHINFVSRANYWLPNICRFGVPQREAKPKKLAMVKRLAECQSKMPFAPWEPQSASNSNDASSVVAWHGLLVPGDSSKTSEKRWASELAGVSQTRILLLGHHGSHTSTSHELLKRLPHLKAAVASARRKRYGHPHSEVERALRNFRVPLLTTEDWGNIIFWL